MLSTEQEQSKQIIVSVADYSAMLNRVEKSDGEFPLTGKNSETAFITAYTFVPTFSILCPIAV